MMDNKIPIEDLSYTGPRMRSLDRKLSMALNSVLSTGQYETAKKEVMRKNHNVITDGANVFTGRQMLRTIYDILKVSDNQMAKVGLETMWAMSCKGDSGLPGFMELWERVDQDSGLGSDGVKLELLMDKLKDVPCMSLVVSLYSVMDDNDSEKSYASFRGHVEKAVSVLKQRKQLDALKRDMTYDHRKDKHNPYNPAYPAVPEDDEPGGGKNKNNQKHDKKGYDGTGPKNGKGNYNKTDGNGKNDDDSKGNDKGKGKGKGKGKAQTPGRRLRNLSAKLNICMFHLKGDCRRIHNGGTCLWRHVTMEEYKAMPDYVCIDDIKLPQYDKDGDRKETSTPCIIEIEDDEEVHCQSGVAMWLSTAETQQKQ